MSKSARAGPLAPTATREPSENSVFLPKTKCHHNCAWSERRNCHTSIPASKVCFTNTSSVIESIPRGAVKTAVTSFRLVLFTELILVRVLVLHILWNTRGTLNQETTSQTQYETQVTLTIWLGNQLLSFFSLLLRVSILLNHWHIRITMKASAAARPAL